MNIDLYLLKLGLKNQKPSLAFLNEIISAHQKIISFNNLEVFFHRRQILNLELETLFQKIIIRGEGGYCFENNKVFFYLLQELGFNVAPKAARVLYNKTGDIPRTHRTTIITIDNKKFLADVGFGRYTPPRGIDLYSDNKDHHHIIKKDDVYNLNYNNGDTNISLYSFDDCQYQESDFALANYFTNTHPDSNFLKSLMVTKRDGESIELINNTIYSKIDNNERLDFTISNQEDFQIYLKKFGIEKSYDFSMLTNINIS